MLAVPIVLLVGATAWANGAADANACITALTRNSFDEAIKLCTRALDSGELNRRNQAITHYNRGLAYQRKGDFDAAIRDYDAAVQIDPQYANAYNNRADVHRHRGELDAAIRDADAAIRIDPNHATAYWIRGTVYLEKGDFTAALRDYAAAIRLKPDWPQAYDSRGFALWSTGNDDSALRDYDTAIRLDPTYLLAYVGRGVLEFSRGRLPEAVDEFVRAVQLKGAQADHLYAVLWLHISRARAGQVDADEFRKNVAGLDLQQWPGPVLSFFLKQTSADQVLAAAQSPNPRTTQEQRCEALFYVGEQALLEQNTGQARQMFTEARNICPWTWVEREAAVAELSRIGK